jgi:hypothetical protein
MRAALRVVAAGLLAGLGCGVHPIPIESGATFAAHQENRRFVVDKPIAGAPDVVDAASLLRGPGGPAWALRRGDDTLAVYWIVGDMGTVARSGDRSSDPSLGEIHASWDQNAIRLHLEPPGGPVFVSDVFARTDLGGGTASFSRAAQTVLDVRGRFRAALRDPSGKEVGWLGLRIGPYEAAPRVYEGSLPPGVDEKLGVAAVLSLANEIDWIESHTVNVYQGDRGPLIQSVPMR